MAKIIPRKSMRERVVTMPFYPSRRTFVRQICLVVPVIFLAVIFHTIALAQTSSFLMPPAEFQAFDTPNDAGDSISLTWSTSPNDAPDVFYVIYLAAEKSRG